MKFTDCDCPHHGWCPRHACFKTPMLHWLCQNDPSRFEAWERGEGLRSRVITEPPGERLPPMPSLLQRAANFGRAVVEHAANGFATVDDAEYERRLSICRACPLFDAPAIVCRHEACGCQLAVKARWASSECPLSQWSPKNVLE